MIRVVFALAVFISVLLTTTHRSAANPPPARTILFVDDHEVLYRAGGGVMDIELMVSRDGLEWERPFRQPYFIPRSPGEQFDSGTIVTNANMIVHGDEMRMYYGAYSSGAIGGGNNITGDQQKSGVGLVTLPLDRFAGIRSESELPSAKLKSPPNISQITLKPLDLANRTAIHLNANSLRHRVAWNEKSLADLPSGRYHLRLHLQQAEVFAVTIE